MKKNNIIILLNIILVFSSCFDDKGNYEYDTPEVITITGINSQYEKRTGVDSLVFTPAVSSTDPTAEFEYYWGVFQKDVAGVQKLDTLAKTLSIKYLIKQEASTWQLVFVAKNKKTGYQQYAKSTIQVTTDFTRGWYVLTDNGTQSDLDLFLTPTSLMPTSKVENVYSLINGKKIDGTALGMNFDATYKTRVVGVTPAKPNRALYVFTNKDASIVETNSMKQIRDFNSCFYSAPTIKAPGAMMVGVQANFFTNNGVLHDIGTMTVNYGIFGQAQMRDSKNSPYHLSRFYMHVINAYPIFFDELSSSFVSTSASASILTALPGGAGTIIPANNNNKKLLYMGMQKSTPFTGIAVLEDKTNPALKIISTITTGPFVLTADTILATKKIFNATNYTCNINNESLLYFVTGNNELWSYNLTNKFEQLQFKAPVGEIITFIKHRRWVEGLNSILNFNYVMVGTTDGTNYTVRMFTKTAGNLDATPAVTLAGKGRATDVLYLAPGLGQQNPYPNSY